MVTYCLDVNVMVLNERDFTGCSNCKAEGSKRVKNRHALELSITVAGMAWNCVSYCW